MRTEAGEVHPEDYAGGRQGYVITLCLDFRLGLESAAQSCDVHAQRVIIELICVMCEEKISQKTAHPEFDRFFLCASKAPAYKGRGLSEILSENILLH